MRISARHLVLVVLVITGVVGSTEAPTLAASHEASAKIDLSRSVGPPTIRLWMRGARFDPTEAVDIAFDGATFRRVVTDWDGNFRTTFRVPASALPGEHTYRVTRIGSGGVAREDIHGANRLAIASLRQRQHRIQPVRESTRRVQRRRPR